MSEIRHVAYNSIVQVIGKAISMSLALGAFAIMTRYLGQEGFGYYTTIYGFLAIFGVLVDFGLQMTTAQLLADPKENEQEILGNALTIRIVASVIFLGIAPLIALTLPYPEIVKLGIAIAAFGYVFSSLVATVTAYFQKNLIIYQAVIAEVIAKIFYAVGIIGVVLFNGGLLGIVLVVCLDSILVWFILRYFASRRFKLKLTYNKEVSKKILLYTWPIALTIALNLVYFKGDIFIMSLIRSQAEVGLYGAPYRVLEVLISIVFLLLGLVLPLMANAVAINNIDKLKNIIQATFDAAITGTLPMIVGGYFVGVPMMVLISGGDFAISGELIKILLLATGAIFIAAIFGYAVVALKQQKRMIKFYAANAIFSIAGYLFFIPLYSYWGAAWMTVATELVIVATAWYVLHQTINFIPNFTQTLKVMIASLIMGLGLWFLPTVNVIATVLFGIIIYGISLYLVGGINKQFINEIKLFKKA
jgi:O-antigen/teichoic acid export membrane protein